MNTKELLNIHVLLDQEDTLISDDFDWRISAHGEIVSEILLRNPATMQREWYPVFLANLILGIRMESRIKYINGKPTDLRKINLAQSRGNRTENEMASFKKDETIIVKKAKKVNYPTTKRKIDFTGEA